MVAFEIFWWPIYWYGIFYCITFLVGYVFLTRLPNHSIFAWGKNYKRLYSLLQNSVDDLFLVCMLWVILGWRLWHVFFYERYYYQDHLVEILQFNKWWMSFVWGILWVVIWLIYITKKHLLSRKEFRLLWDVVLCIVPLWSLLWRIWNFLNQELIWRTLDSFSVWRSDTFSRRWVVYIYDQRDMLQRVNVNLIQSFLEWFLLLCIVRTIFLLKYKEWYTRVWLLSWVYLMGYWTVRFIAEYVKDLPVTEMYSILSISQWMSIVLIASWGALIYSVMSSKN